MEPNNRSRSTHQPTRVTRTSRRAFAGAALLALAIGCDDTSADVPTMDADGGAAFENNPGGGPSGLESEHVGTGTKSFVGNRVLEDAPPAPFETTTELCDPRADSAEATRSFELRHLRVPRFTGEDTGGFDLDGIDNSQVDYGGVGKTAEGCGTYDRPHGVDGGANHLAVALENILAISDDFDASLDARPARIVLTHWNETADDPCVAVTVELGEAGSGQRVTGGGEVVGGVVRASFDETLPLAVPLHSGLGEDAAAPVDFAMHDVRVELRLDPSLTLLLPGSYVGGVLFFGSTDPAYEDVPGLRDSLDVWATSVGYDVSQKTVLLNAFASGQDLHVEPDGTRTPCTAVSALVTNRNAISLTLEVDSLLDLVILPPIP